MIKLRWKFWEKSLDKEFEKLGGDKKSSIELLCLRKEGEKAIKEAIQLRKKARQIRKEIVELTLVIQGLENRDIAKKELKEAESELTQLIDKAKKIPK